ncbi:MAG: hypothetical protein Q8Q23_01750 [bacterium]|nr:hypothetical protein [bacterium]
MNITSQQTDKKQTDKNNQRVQANFHKKPLESNRNANPVLKTSI